MAQSITQNTFWCNSDQDLNFRPHSLFDVGGSMFDVCCLTEMDFRRAVCWPREQGSNVVRGNWETSEAANSLMASGALQECRPI